MHTLSDRSRLQRLCPRDAVQDKTTQTGKAQWLLGVGVGGRRQEQVEHRGFSGR